MGIDDPKLVAGTVVLVDMGRFTDLGLRPYSETMIKNGGALWVLTGERGSRATYMCKSLYNGVEIPFHPVRFSLAEGEEQ